MIGDSVRRVEDPVLLRGRGRFAADIAYPGQLHMRVVRSPAAHGRIRNIDTAAARAMPGVHAVWTYRDVEEVGPIEFRLTPMDALLPYRQPVLARGVVRYVGEPVAVVFADDAYRAEDAAELVDVDIEPWPAILDPHTDPAPWIDAADARWAAQREIPADLSSEATQLHLDYGDVDAAMAGADRVVEVDVEVGRHTGVAMECRGGSAYLEDSTGILIVEGAAKVPFWNRDAIAAMIGWSPQNVHVREAHVGGGFGPRGELYPEDVLVPLAVVRFGRPVRWVEDRQENLVALNHSRDQRHVLRAGVDAEGRILALDAEFWTDQGGYVRTHSATVSSLTASMLPGPYRIPHYRVLGHIRMTNKTPAGTYRSPGRYEGTFARERLLDKIAEECGVDRWEVRKRNFIRVEEMPYQRPIQAMGTELIYDSGDYELLARRAEEAFGLAEVRADVERRRARGEKVGIGYGWFVEKSGLGPYEGARVAVDTAGAVLLTTGTSSVGQGVDTVLSQVVGDVLDITVDRIRSVRGQTDRFSYGRGAFAERQSVMAGSATLEAAELVRRKAITVAADALEIDPADLELVDGGVQVVGDAATRMSLGEVAARLEPVNAARLGLSPGLTAEGWFRCDHMTYPYGVHISVVSIDEGTGAPLVEKYFVGYDVGKALNHALVEGQIAGGVAQGLGGALLEEFRYGEDGQPQATTFMDYLMPTIAEMPDLEVLITEDAPSPLNPLGVKGAGEGGVTAAAACLASAVDDALQAPGFVVSTPIQPHRIRQWIAAEYTHKETECAS